MVGEGMITRLVLLHTWEELCQQTLRRGVSRRVKVTDTLDVSVLSFSITVQSASHDFIKTPEKSKPVKEHGLSLDN